MHLAPVVAIRQMIVAGSGERVISRFIRVELARALGILLARAVVAHHEEHVMSQQLYVNESCPAEKAHHLSVEEMAVARG